MLCGSAKTPQKEGPDMAHANARLGPAGRRVLVELMINEGMPERRAAARLCVSPCTAHRWKQRWLAASDGDQRSGRWALDRSSRPHRSPARTSAELEARVLAERERTGWGPRLIAGTTGVAHSTVHAILKRHGRSRVPRTPRESFRRYEWPCPGDLLHMDIKRYRRFRRPGHPFISDERQTSKEINTRLGFDYCHAIIDDHSRIAYAELLPDTRAPTVTAFTDRALHWFAQRGINAKRVMTDGAWSYTHNRSLHALLAARGVHHILTPPYTPRWNGKVERLHQTMDREWARGQLYRNSTARNRALKHWLRHYNQRRPHSSLGGQPPITRAHNL
jgi:transposase InsO family protein